MKCASKSLLALRLPDPVHSQEGHRQRGPRDVSSYTGGLAGRDQTGAHSGPFWQEESRLTREFGGGHICLDHEVQPSPSKASPL